MSATPQQCREYRQRKRARAQAEALFEQNQTWAEAIAAKVWRGLPRGFDLPDLQQHALIGLWKCALQFDPSRGVPFQGFAYRAVVGSVYMAARGNAYDNATAAPLVVDVPTDTDIERMAKLAARKQQVREMVQRLPNEHRDCCILHWWGGPHVEVGRDQTGLHLQMVAHHMDIPMARAEQLRREALSMLSLMVLQESPDLLTEEDLVA